MGDGYDDFQPENTHADPRFHKMIGLLAALPDASLKQALLRVSATMILPGLLDAGATEVTLDVLQELAHNSPDPMVRCDARRIVHERKLDLILWA
ncbi:MAG: hypothetical protein ACRCYU_04120, partial [Nocardioides sp.]